MTTRKATIDDIPFIVETIIAAEKSGSDICGLCRLLELPELEVSEHLTEMLEEEIDGCEFSVSSFIIAEIDNEPAGAFGGWIEGVNEDELPSSILKANLMQYYIPADNIRKMVEKSNGIVDLQFTREPKTYQLEYGFVRPEYRGRGVIQALLGSHERLAQGCDRMYLQVYGRNERAIRAYQKMGYEVVGTRVSCDPHINDFLPDSKKILMQKDLSYGKK